MIRVAFWYDRPQEYTGGLNYIKNLLCAISLANSGRIEPYIFFGKMVDESVVQQFVGLGTVVRTSVLDRKSLLWYVHNILFRLFNSLWIVKYILKKHRIAVVSHAEHIHGSGLPFRVITWIPDFQYLHLPHLFPSIDSESETKRWLKIIAKSDAVVLSSYAALADLQRIAPPELLTRAKVIQFVSQPHSRVNDETESITSEMVESKYGFTGRFFFLPNQFWAHKNHKIVFEAVRLLKQHGGNVTVLCTGNLRDYRLKDTQHADSLREFVNINGLQDSIRILGLIPYDEVMFLMRHCVAVLNPSLFEGWSSTVEEARSIGKRLVLSNISVHIEQNPPNVHYFPPDDAEALAVILAKLWSAAPDASEADMRRRARENLQQRTLAYGRNFIELAERLTSGSHAI